MTDCRRLLHFYKIQTNLTPAYLKDPLPPVKNHQYGTRSEHVLQEIKCNTDIHRGSFYPDIVRCWNRIGNALRNSTISLTTIPRCSTIAISMTKH